MIQRAIRAEGLSKRYIIGKKKDEADGRRSIFRNISAPFEYLSTTIRPPTEDQILWALNNVSFEVDHGEAVGIIGRNGAGKSTLLKLLSRITEPTSGRVVLRGRVGSLLEIGTGFHPELTGRENIYLSGAILGMKRAEINRKFDEIAAFAEVDRFLDTQVKRYSSGMYVRLAFAVAAHLETEILLIDEVLAVGDARFQKKCLGMMDDVTQYGRTVLFVSHNLVAVQNLCSRAILLHHGELVKDGRSEDVVAQYLATGAGDIKVRQWDDIECAPGNDKVRIHTLSISPRKSEDGGRITMETPIDLELQLWNLVPGARMLFGFRFFTDKNEVAFTTISNESQAGFEGETMKRGLYRCACKLPPNLLNEGGYRVALFVYQDRGMIIFRMDDALSFEVINVGKRPGYRYSREPGAVRPLFAWTTDFQREM
jgi:lipopolysaccharide transport system ATP-binding protein